MGGRIQFTIAPAAQISAKPLSLRTMSSRLHLLLKLDDLQTTYVADRPQHAAALTACVLLTVASEEAGFVRDRPRDLARCR